MSLRQDIMSQSMRDTLNLAAQKMTKELHNRLCRLGHEAHMAGMDLEVGPLHGCEDRPTIDGHFAKVKFDYRFVEPGDPNFFHGWERFETSKRDPTPVEKNSGQP